MVTVWPRATVAIPMSSLQSLTMYSRPSTLSPSPAGRRGADPRPPRKAAERTPRRSALAPLGVPSGRCRPARRRWLWPSTVCFSPNSSRLRNVRRRSASTIALKLKAIRQDRRRRSEGALVVGTVIGLLGLGGLDGSDDVGLLAHGRGVHAIARGHLPSARRASCPRCTQGPRRPRCWCWQARRRRRRDRVRAARQASPCSPMYLATPSFTRRASSSSSNF